jgi:hypothetical protein
MWRWCALAALLQVARAAGAFSLVHPLPFMLFLRVQWHAATAPECSACGDFFSVFYSGLGPKAVCPSGPVIRPLSVEVMMYVPSHSHYLVLAQCAT